MSLPTLTALPAELHALVEHARQTFVSRLDEGGQTALAAWDGALPPA